MTKFVLSSFLEISPTATGLALVSKHTGQVLGWIKNKTLVSPSTTRTSSLSSRWFSTLPVTFQNCSASTPQSFKPSTSKPQGFGPFTQENPCKS